MPMQIFLGGKVDLLKIQKIYLVLPLKDRKILVSNNHSALVYFPILNSVFSFFDSVSNFWDLFYSS